MALFSVGFSVLIYLKANPSAVRNCFMTFALSTALWLISGFFLYSNITVEQSVLWAKVAFAAASLCIVSLYYLLVLVPDQTVFPVRKRDVLFGITGVSFAVLSIFSRLLIENVSYQDTFKITVEYGPLYLAFTVYALIAIAVGAQTLLKRFRAASGRRKLQIQYFLFGAAVPAVGASITNAVLPLAFRISDLAPYGRFFALVFLAMTAHGIIRYRLMDIKVVIRQGVVYVCAISVAVLILAGFAGFLNNVTDYRRENVPLATSAILALIVAIIFQPIKRGLQNIFNRYVYRYGYDYQRTVREASVRLSTTLELHALLDYLVTVIGKTLKVEMVAVYLRQPQQGFVRMVLQRFVEWNEGLDGATLSGTPRLVQFLERERRLLICDEAPRNPDDRQLAGASEEVQSLGGEIAFPFFQDQSLSGILLVGPKLSGDPYFSEDLDLLSTLASQASIAIRNAQLYGEIALANEYISNILANIESGVIAIDAKGMMTLFNPTAERMIGQRAAAGALSASGLPPALAETLVATLQDGSPRLHVEMVIPDESGRPAPVVLNATPLRDDEGRILGAVGVFSDLTKLKELEAEKQRTERLTAWRALAAGIAHEIKNPLVSIKTFAELLQERYTDFDFRENFSKVAIKEIERIDALVGRLRGLGISSNQALYPLDLRQPVEEILTLLVGQLDQKQVTVVREYESELPLAAGDYAQLKQLFLNLFLNSIDAMDRGGQIIVRISTRSGFGQDVLRAEVRDNGRGIPVELLDKIFNPFVTTKHEGSGLGLAICRGIADAHRATIRAENNPSGRGATITVEFPVTMTAKVPV